MAEGEIKKITSNVFILFSRPNPKINKRGVKEGEEEGGEGGTTSRGNSLQTGHWEDFIMF